MNKEDVKKHFTNMIYHRGFDEKYHRYLEEKDVDLENSETLYQVLEELTDSELNILFEEQIKTILITVSKILIHIGYPRVKRYIPYLMVYFQDINWPGGEGVINLLESMKKEDLLPYLEETFKKAESDPQWLDGLAMLLKYDDYDESDFSPEIRHIYRKAVEIFEEDS